MSLVFSANRLNQQKGKGRSGAGCQRSVAVCKHSKASQKAIITGRPKVFVLWDCSQKQSCKQRVFIVFLVQRKLQPSWSEDRNFIYLSLPLPLSFSLSPTHWIFFLCQPFKPEITGSVTFIIPFILAWFRVQPSGESLLPVSICFEFVVYTECYCVSGCNTLLTT